MSGIKVSLVKVTPKMACDWLAKNKGNRKLRGSHVELLARAMRDGTFQTTHQGVAFNDKKILIDGQHRLTAIVKSNTTQTLMVSHGVVSSNLDNGLGRTLSDLTGEDRAVTSIVGVLFRCVLGGKKPLVHEAETIIDSFRTQLNMLEEMKSLKNRSRLTGASICAAAVLRLAQTRDTEKQAMVQQLVRTLTHGELMGARPIIHSFYKQIMENPTYGGTAQVELLARAWSAFDPDNTERSKLQVTNSSTQVGEAREVFHLHTAGNFR